MGVVERLCSRASGGIVLPIIRMEITMIRINQIKLPVTHTKEKLTEKICRQLHIAESDLLEVHIVKKSLDARK